MSYPFGPDLPDQDVPPVAGWSCLLTLILLSVGIALLLRLVLG